MVSVSALTLRRVSGASQDHNFYPLMTGRGSDGVSGFYGCKLVNPTLDPHTVPVKHTKETQCRISGFYLFSLFTSQCKITIDSCLNVSCSMLCPISCIQILER